MKITLSALALLFAAGAAFAQSDAELRSDGKNTDNVLNYGMGYGQNRFSRSSKSISRRSRSWCRSGTYRSAATTANRASRWFTTA